MAQKQALHHIIYKHDEREEISFILISDYQVIWHYIVKKWLFIQIYRI